MDAIITYSRDGVTYNSVYPVFRDAGDYPVYYKIANDYYETVEGSETVSIEKAPITITAGNQTVDYGDDIDSELYQVTGILTGHRISSILLTPSTSDVTDNGRIDISDVVILNEDDEENNNDSGNEGNAGGGGTDNGDSSEDVGAGDRAYAGIYIAIFVVCIIAVMAVFRRRAEV